jgi:hypothetical protein
MPAFLAISSLTRLSHSRLAISRDEYFPDFYFREGMPQALIIYFDFAAREPRCAIGPFQDALSTPLLRAHGPIDCAYARRLPNGP